MSKRTVEWPAWPGPQGGTTEGAGLRERKKRLMRQKLSDTATEMFIDQGFDAVRVSDIAEACGVSEKTVYNYFPTKESLLLDRWDTTMASLRAGLADRGVSPVEAALTILGSELSGLMSWLAAQDDPVAACAIFQRFGTLINATPALRAYQLDMTDQLISVAAQILAGRTGLKPDDPEPQIAATALLGLWHVQFHSLRKHVDGTYPLVEIHHTVTGDVERAGKLIDAGLHSLEQAGHPKQGPPMERSGRARRIGLSGAR